MRVLLYAVEMMHVVMYLMKTKIKDIVLDVWKQILKMYYYGTETLDNIDIIINLLLNYDENSSWHPSKAVRGKNQLWLPVLLLYWETWFIMVKTNKNTADCIFANHALITKWYVYIVPNSPNYAYIILYSLISNKK